MSSKSKADFAAFLVAVMLAAIIAFVASYKTYLLNWMLAPFVILGYVRFGCFLAVWFRK